MRDPLTGFLRWAQRRRHGWKYILGGMALIQLAGIGLVALDLPWPGLLIFFIGALLNFAIYREMVKR
jgi:predicted small integral membrane protein